ncbi:hypothetical protein [Mesorhizobium retamae]|nr:hypothetical protein [Mesorhizobium sp. IRAMC:0171]
MPTTPVVTVSALFVNEERKVLMGCGPPGKAPGPDTGTPSVAM